MMCQSWEKLAPAELRALLGAFGMDTAGSKQVRY
jgi:hypothetical protein